jgi:DNA-directed RNA polymerases I, II, and III subunit RPABC1
MSFLNKLTKSRKTILEMMKLRGYDSDKYNNYSSKELDIMLKNMDKKINYNNMPLDMNFDHNSSDKKCVLKYIISRVRVANLKTLITELIEYEIVKPYDDIIFIVKDKINNLETFYNLFNSFLETHNIFIQIFSIDSLIRNITNHEFVPNMRIISETEKEDIKKKYNIENNSNMPLILKSDPAAMFYGVKSGDFIEITRTSETSGIYISYRYCE